MSVAYGKRTDIKVLFSLKVTHIFIQSNIILFSRNGEKKTKQQKNTPPTPKNQTKIIIQCSTNSKRRECCRAAVILKSLHVLENKQTNQTKTPKFPKCFTPK